MSHLSGLSAPSDPGAPVAALARELATHLGLPGFVAVCTDLMGGADRREHVAELRYLTGHGWEEEAAVLDPARWHDYWVRTWGARGLLHVWDDAATAAVLVGLTDRHWRPTEMCLKVATRHEVGGAGDGAALLAEHELPRVRAQAMRALGAVGDTEHTGALRARMDDASGGVRAAAARAWEQMALRLDLDERW